MKILRALALLSALLLPCSVHAAGDDEALVKSVLQTQVEAWNRGDIPTFVTTYAADCIFIGKEVAQGRAQLLARYQRTYPTPAAMGKLTFSAMAVHFLDKDVAIVTAQWHLERTGQGGGPAGGLFSLVFHRQADGWKIALDHTS